MLVLRRLSLTFLSIIICISAEARSNSPKAARGVLDLRDIDVNTEFIVRLNGEWEFYWEKMLRPADFYDHALSPDFYGTVPAYWTDYPKEVTGGGRFGFATYRLSILLPEGFREPLGVDMPVFDSSYDIYINGEYCGWNGITGKSADESKPGYKRLFFRLDPDSDTLSIVINVSNYSHRRGGFWLPVKMGTFDKTRKQLAATWARDWSAMSLLTGFSLFFFFFFLLYPRERVLAYFCMATIGLSLRPLFTSNFLINDFLDLNWEWIIRFEYLGLYCIVVGLLWFITVLYPSKTFRFFANTVSWFFVAVFVMTLFIPVKLFSYTTFVIYPTLIILMIYSLARSLMGIIGKNRIDIAYFLTFLLLIAGGIHDIRISLGKPGISSEYIMTNAILIFVMVQAGLMLYKWVRSYHEKEKLQSELEFINRNLESIINERTRELKERNEEIEKQSLRIASQNTQLSETIQMKNKIFSLIAHDLRSPVVNILYMLNLLKEKEYKEKYDNFANTSIQYAQMVISLLENMLVWGRGQEDKIKYAPKMQNLADVILTNLSIYKETADKKEISMNFTQVGSSMAYFDKDLLDIIIRNLLSNAIKYTPRGGRISILLKDRSMAEGGMLIKICDNGTGISPVKQKYLFTSTEMTSTPGTDNEKGTGLGLKLCNELVKINKGTISVESREGEGSCFSIILPEETAG
jgi:signal transduction histidine kinase